MGLMDRGRTALIERMRAAAGRVVSYTRKSDGLSVTFTAWVGNTLYSRQTAEVGANRIWGERDYLFAAADLMIGGILFTPAKGDRITETVDGVALTFELQTPTGEPVWRYSDQTRGVIRAHCKRVALAVPANTSPPVITGSAAVGQTLSASTGSWSGTPTGFAYQWNRDGSAIGGEIAHTLNLTTADAGRQLSVTVTASNAVGSHSETSTETGPVRPHLTNLTALVDVSLCRRLGLLWQDAGQNSPAAAASDPVRVIQCPYTGMKFTAPSDSQRPLLSNPAGSIWCLSFDGVDDCLDFAGVASGPLSAHFACRWTDGNTAGVAIAGAAGGQKLKLFVNLGTGIQGGKEGVENWTPSNTALNPNVDYVAGLDYDTTGAALNWLNGATDGTAKADMSGYSWTANVTRIGANTSGGERWVGRMYGWCLCSAHQASGDLAALHTYLGAMAGLLI